MRFINMTDGNYKQDKHGNTVHNLQKYDKEYHPEHYANYSTLGCAVNDIAVFFGVNPSTLHHWIKTYPEMMEAKVKFKMDLCTRAKLAITKRAMGYRYEEEKTVKEGGNVTRVEVTDKEMTPDVKAAQWLLAKHMPEMYHDKIDVNINGDISVKTTLAERLTGGSKR